jgi:hypothetical protein
MEDMDDERVAGEETEDFAFAEDSWSAVLRSAFNIEVGRPAAAVDINTSSSANGSGVDVRIATADEAAETSSSAVRALDLMSSSSDDEATVVGSPPQRSPKSRHRHVRHRPLTQPPSTKPHSPSLRVKIRAADSGWQGARPAPLDWRFHRVPTHFPMCLHRV